MNFKEITHVYFIGIGGIGMSALARYFNKLGKKIAGYDKTPTSLTAELITEGIQIHFEDDVSKIPSAIKNANNKNEILVVYTPAIPKEHSELNFLRDNNFQIKKRSEVLGIITKNTKTIAVAGTHGKTTTSSIVAHILKNSGINCAAFLGGISKNYNTNFLLPEKTTDMITVVEADEYDRSFLTLYPHMAIITSMDADHLDIYHSKKNLEESYTEFASQVQNDGLLLYNAALPFSTLDRNKKTYSIKQKADYVAENIRVENHCFVFDFIADGKKFEHFSLGLPGRHNVENAVAACAAALNLGVEADKIKAALDSYTGVRRRFDVQFNSGKTIYIDDYAHHPEELRAAILSAKELYPGKKITGIFQPHLFSRTRDFADGFAQSLSLADEIILLEIYPAREQPIAGINSQWLLEKIPNSQKKLLTKDETLHEINSRTDWDVLMTLGAGDIDTMVEPIRNILEKLSVVSRQS